MPKHNDPDALLREIDDLSSELTARLEQMVKTDHPHRRGDWAAKAKAARQIRGYARREADRRRHAANEKGRLPSESSRPNESLDFDTP